MSTSQAGHTQDYIDANKGPVILGISISVCILSTIFVALRLITRRTIIGKLHLDDWLTLAAVVFQWLAVVCTIIAVRKGNGRHFDTLDTSQQEAAILWTILGFPFGLMAFGLPKLAVSALLMRLMVPSRLHKMLLWFLPLFTLACLIVCVALLFAKCSPAESQWNFSMKGTCWNPYVLVYFALFTGAVCAFTDLYLAVYPATVLWTLQLNMKKKIALSVALGIGSIATIVAIYKCTRLSSLASKDFSYDTSDLVIWTVLEASTIIIACCIPVLQPLIDLILGRRTFTSSNGDRNYGTSRSGQRPAGIELRDSHRRNSHSNPDSKYMGSMGRIELDSQESILGRSSNPKDSASRTGESI